MSAEKQPPPPVDSHTAAWLAGEPDARSQAEVGETTAGLAGTPASIGSAVAVPPELAHHPRYRVLALLGEGGMGAVYKAQHTHMDRLVALKVIRPSLVKHPVSLKRFEQEVRAAARLTHANIVTAYDADRAGSLHFLVMEFVEGQSLADYLRRQGPLPVAEACSYARQAALGLQHAHEKGMVHRDIKPHNLMRTPQGEVKILDFGLARLGQSGSPESELTQPAEDAPDSGGGRENLTGEGAMMGTVDYIAPEQAADAHVADIRADIYSLGCTLYQLLTGRVVFPGGSIADKLVRHRKAMPVSLAHWRPDAPDGLVQLVRRTVAKEPRERFQTPDELAHALAAFSGDAIQLAVPVVRAPEEKEVPTNVFAGIAEDAEGTLSSEVRGERARPIGWVAGALTVLLLALIAAGLWISRRDPAAPTADGRPSPSAKPAKPVEPDPAAPLLAHAGEVRLLESKDAIVRVAVGGGRMAIAGGFDRIPRLLDLNAGKRVQNLEAHPDIIWCVALSPDGRYAASGGQHKALEFRDPAHHDVLRLWDVADGRLLRKLMGHQHVIHHVAFSADSRRLASSSWDRSVRLWDVSGRLAPLQFNFDAPAAATAFLPGDKELLVGTRDGFIRVLDLSTGEERTRIRGPGEESLAVFADGRYLLACGSSGPDGQSVHATVLLHDLRTRQQRRLRGHTDAVLSVAFSPDGRRAVSASLDATVRVWDVESGKELYCDRGHQRETHSAVFTPDGRYVLSAGYEGVVRLWPLPPNLRD